MTLNKYQIFIGTKVYKTTKQDYRYTLYEERKIFWSIYVQLEQKPQDEVNLTESMSTVI